MNNLTFAEKALDIATKYKTLYVMGCFGAPMTAANKSRYINSYKYNSEITRRALIESTSDNTFGFDCICLIKAILWDWSGDKAAQYGGAKYCSNGVPDFGTEEMLSYCTDILSDFNTLTTGEVLYMPGHAGIVVDGTKGLAVEATPKWKDGAQVTAINRNIAGYERRDWIKHGKLKFVDYENKDSSVDITLPVLRKGHKSYEVRQVQRLLNAMECYDQNNKPLVIDGSLGNKTEYAIKNYQRAKKINVTGIVDNETWHKLLTNEV